MATAVLMPKQGQTVESCVLVKWHKKVGDPVKTGDTLCEVETDKATLEVPSTSEGVLLEIFQPDGADVPVLTNIAAIGNAGEDVSQLRPSSGQNSAAPAPAAVSVLAPAVADKIITEAISIPSQTSASLSKSESSKDGLAPGVSPRARHLAESKGINASQLPGTGPGGRVIERDVIAASATMQPLSPAAKALAAQGMFAPQTGTGVGGRIMASDMLAAKAQVAAAPAGMGGQVAASALPDLITEVPLKGVRKLIADRMLGSLRDTAQLTLNGSVDARGIQNYRKLLKQSADKELQAITLNDLVLYAVAKALAETSVVNATLVGDKILQYANVHLAFAVDTSKGLMVPVIRNAHLLSLRQMALEAKRLAKACIDGGITPDELNGGTFTVSNLGAFGVESFTPVLNTPQVGILGVSNIQLKPIQVEDEIQFVPNLGLSLTINHQVVDGAPGAKFLQNISKRIAQFELGLAG